jgi:catechol 2,3-dioxygenase-like lactoylglutathione lyase family enzyme
MIATGLDHVGVVVRDLESAAAAWQALGFQVTPLAPHLPGGITANRCVMLGRGYIELVGNHAGESATIGRFLARGEGIRILSLATPDAEAAAKRLGREVVRSERETPDGPARFARIVLAEFEPRIQLIQHFTPALVWRAPDLVHANGATALLSVTLSAESPATPAAALSRAAGVPVVPDPEGGYALRLAQGEIRILQGGPALPNVTFITVQTPDPTLIGQTVHATGVAIRFQG